MFARHEYTGKGLMFLAETIYLSVSLFYPKSLALKSILVARYDVCPNIMSFLSIGDTDSVFTKYFRLINRSKKCGPSLLRLSGQVEVGSSSQKFFMKAA